MNSARQLIQARGCGIIAGTKTILSGVDCAISEGEWLAITGPNGAGKSTLLRLLAGILTPDSGSIELGGRGLSEYSTREIARMIGYVPQLAALSVSYSVREFVMLGRYCLSGWAQLGSHGKEDEEAVTRAIGEFGLAAFAEQRMTSLSGGERQRALLAGSLVQNPKLLLLDEPSAFLDPRHQIEMAEMLGKLHGRGLTMAVVTHDLNSALLSRADRVLALKDGRSFFCGSSREFLEPDRLEALYSVPFEKFVRGEQAHVFARAGGGRGR
jgi:iron complex transport system ATP-binding protein